MLSLNFVSTLQDESRDILVKGKI